MGRKVINILLIITLILLTWFGLGPVVFADGTESERMYTLLVVAFIYLLVFLIMYYVNKHMKR